ncbi:Glycosyl transferase, group 2 family [hydrothermal vent metagenome]|uniref:Glycosyl transferase, group 2 family n=1 Tax=hydrothermal vent metagenome TaxID=652676 RepID=A0A3B1CXM6_9ZZZZ
MNQAPRITIVAPVFNEVENIDSFLDELVPVLEGMGKPFEILAVDDGSTDGSYDKLMAYHKKDKRVKVIRFRGNFGQTAAFSAGFNFARGETIVTMDADLQNDPADIPALVDKLEKEGHDIVAGWRYERKDKFLSRRLPSIIANKIISKTTSMELHDYGCSLKAFHKDVIKNIKLYGEMHRFIPAIASWMGVSVAEMKVNHRPRTAGMSKYGINRTVRVMLDLLTVKFLLSYSTRPIQIFGLMGLVSGGLGFMLAVWLTVQKFAFNMALSNRPALLLAVLLILIGVQFISMGLLAELQARTYHESQDKPIYVIKNVLD